MKQSQKNKSYDQAKKIRQNKKERDNKKTKIANNYDEKSKISPNLSSIFQQKIAQYTFFNI